MDEKQKFKEKMEPNRDTRKRTSYEHLDVDLFADVVLRCKNNKDTNGQRVWEDVREIMERHGVYKSAMQFRNKWKNLHRSVSFRELIYQRQAAYLQGDDGLSEESEDQRAELSKLKRVSEASRRKILMRTQETLIKHLEDALPHSSSEFDWLQKVAEKFSEENWNCSVGEIRERWRYISRNCRANPKVKSLVDLSRAWFKSPVSAAHWSLENTTILVEVMLEHLEYFSSYKEPQRSEILEQEMKDRGILFSSFDIQTHLQSLREKPPAELSEKLQTIFLAFDGTTSDCAGATMPMKQEPADDFFTVVHHFADNDSEEETVQEEFDAVSHGPWVDNGGVGAQESRDQDFKERYLKFLEKRERNEQKRHEERMGLRQKHLDLLQQIVDRR